MKRLTLAIFLHRGVSPKDYLLRVGKGGQTMELSYFWPREMTDTVTLHKPFENGKGLATEGALQGSSGFDVFLKTMRNTMSEIIKSTAVFKLPFPVYGFY